MDSRNFSLDLLRAVAILMVFIAHTVLSYGAPSMIAPLQFGGTGVDLFFVLSGWLIGYQLFKELSTHGNIDIPRFWFRRWMRTLPAYYAVLIFTIIQLSITKENFVIPYHYFVFLQNYDYPITPFTVSWSLCVEEQFYLAIAPLIVFLTKTGRNNRTIILVLLLLLPTIFRELDWYTSLKETHVRWDCCVMGVLLANIRFSYPSIWQYLLRISAPSALLGLLIYLSFYYFRWHPELYISDPSKLFLAFIFGSWIIWANTAKISFGNLINRGIFYISTRSYAIYLLHPDALALCKKFILGQHFIVYIAAAFFISCIASEVLYRTVETPIMKMRSHFKFSQSRHSLAL